MKNLCELLLSGIDTFHDVAFAMTDVSCIHRNDIWYKNKQPE
ncbi:hypothetical protein [Lutibacter flavus]|nr:hypothetical protein [Lutibacter flavus]